MHISFRVFVFCVGSDSPIADLWELSTSSLVWSQHLPSSSSAVWPVACADTALTRFHDKLYLWGGDDLVITYGTLYSYDLQTRLWRLLGSEDIVGARISPRFSSSIITVEDRMIIFSGYYYVPPQQVTSKDTTTTYSWARK